jgi:hypothetical protein
MSRQINSHLFNDSFQPNNGLAPLEPMPVNINESHDPGPLYDDLVGRIDKARYELQDYLKTLNLRLEKVVQRIHTIEDRMKQGAIETHERFNFIGQRINQRNNSDLKVEALIERHNQIVQSFELRLSQAQKVIENQSLQLQKQQELIENSRRQIEKLKRL